MLDQDEFDATIQAGMKVITAMMTHLAGDGGDDLRRAVATYAKAQHDAYLTAGFNEDQAMRLTLSSMEGLSKSMKMG